MGRKRVLVVDDEESMQKIVRYALEQEGYEVKVAGDAETAATLMPTFSPDLIILDVMLPGDSGLEFCRGVRENSCVPILMLSARGEEVDKILGLEFGADDYIVKPFSPRELVSRVKAHLRRQDMDINDEPEIKIGELRINLDSHQVYVADEVLSLTGSEFQILRLLSRYPGKVFSRQGIMDSLSGGGFIDSNFCILS